MSMTANEHYRKAVALLTVHDQRAKMLEGKSYPAEVAQIHEMGLQRVLKMAEIEMMVANYKAGT